MSVCLFRRRPRVRVKPLVRRHCQSVGALHSGVVHVVYDFMAVTDGFREFKSIF